MPNGYEFVPLPPTVNREERPNAVFHRRVRGAMWIALEVEYVALEPIHIGSGFRALRGQRAVRAAARSGDRLMIPGSSMKGLLRARYEAITKSCTLHRAPREQRLGPQLPSRSFPGYDVEFSSAVRRHPAFEECAPGRWCSACALFGRMSQRGRVSVHDLLAPIDATAVDEELPKRYSPRPHHLGRFIQDQRISKLTVQELYGRKLHVGNAPPPGTAGERAEAIRRGTRLAGTITGVNISLAELGGLLYVLGAYPLSTLKIGSGKAHAFGRLALAKNIALRVMHPDPFDATDFFARVRQAFEGSSDYWDKGAEALLAMHGGDMP